jgi:decaprenylphospho-beta-D-erythro-pentofuranosid-2-ulose 2-reductase
MDLRLRMSKVWPCMRRIWWTPGKTRPMEPPRTALVLGGNSEIAVAILSELAGRGLRAAHLAAREPAAAARRVLEAAPTLEVTWSRWEATRPDGHDALVETAAEDLGPIDIVICAVGMLGHHAGLSMGPAAVDEMVRSNFAGPAAALAAVAPVLVEQGYGTIVVLSSVAGLRARRSNYVYGSSKAGLDVFSQGLGDALVGSGVRVLVVRPGFVRSKMTAGLEPAPFATDPDVVARTVADALGGRREVVSVPAKLGPGFAVLRNLPRALWRRIAADR